MAAPPAYAPPPMPRTRPIGVTILAILVILGGILLLLIGLALIALSGLIGLLGAPMFGLPVLAIGGLLFLVGILLIVSGSGLLKLRIWAWWLATIALVLGAVSSILSANWFSVIIDVLLIVYLVLVKKHFR